LCVQIAVLGSAKDPFTSYQMIGLGEILGWLDSWQIPRRWPAGRPAPFRQAARPRSRAQWALGGHFGASQVPDCESIGPGGIDIDQLIRADTLTPVLAGSPLAQPTPIRLGPRTLSVAGVLPHGPEAVNGTPGASGTVERAGQYTYA
jgi:hypothetical protein